MPPPHFPRTFVEKMFAIHGRLELLKRNGQPLGAYARRYHGLFQLAAPAEAIATLRSDEYAAIKVDYDRIARIHFPGSDSHPDEMSFARSDALLPPEELAAAIGDHYEVQCRSLYYGPYPSWAEIQARQLPLLDRRNRLSYFGILDRCRWRGRLGFGS